ncbi:MAG: hypothetical protein EBW55_01140 [Betaproteobacteria bacterium]|nr:hypothetical protein [Betaproteobacteria bacterium]NCV69317.1 hypothetical protein [Betaproteobacteria bacterium]NDA21150.1 hypothetical protein [Betaproteobacteria bacterium]NDA52288.1 hypothetical protein [Betaproteobacteria bacterium]NDA69827.1 hypothetical protein [Betaproteobacteria bacterium]
MAPIRVAEILKPIIACRLRGGVPGKGFRHRNLPAFGEYQTSQSPKCDILTFFERSSGIEVFNQGVIYDKYRDAP